MSNEQTQIQMLVLDVDGVLTDGRISYTSDNQELKSFHIQDGLGIKLLMNAGVEIAIITGRVSPMVARRAKELGIETLIQGREDKLQALTEILEQRAFGLEAVAYMGDDLPDYRAVKSSAVGMTVADAHPEIRAIADWTSSQNGGFGAVREACDHLLRSMGLYQQAIAKFSGETP